MKETILKIQQNEVKQLNKNLLEDHDLKTVSNDGLASENCNAELQGQSQINMKNNWRNE
jgi:hypothetical protein